MTRSRYPVTPAIAVRHATLVVGLVAIGLIAVALVAGSGPVAAAGADASAAATGAGSVAVADADADAGTVEEPDSVADAGGGSDVDGADHGLRSGGLYWRGQVLGFTNGTTDIEADALLLREYDASDGELGSVVREVEVDDGEGVLWTDDLEGTYVLVPAGRRDVAVSFEDGAANGTVAVGEATPFEVLVQTLDVEWEESGSDTVGTDLRLEMESNRARYNVNVSGPDLTFDELEAAFMGTRLRRDRNGPFGDRQPFARRHRTYDAYADEGVIVLRGFGDGALRPDFGELDALPGALAVEVTDTGVRDAAEFSAGAVDTGPFAITELTVPERVDPGDAATLSATVENRRSETVTETVSFALGDGPRSSVDATIPAGGSTTVSATFTAPEAPGEVDYDVSTRGDSVTGTVAVDGADTPTPASTTSTPAPTTPTSAADTPNDAGSSDGTERTEGEDGSSATVDDDGILNLSLQVRVGAGALVTLLSAGTYVLWRRR